MSFVKQSGKKLINAYCLVIYAVLSAFITSHFSKYVTDNDAFLYLSIANKYAHGHFYEAINDYWSPLLSWLLTPFIILKVDGILSIRITQFLIGGLTIIGFIKIVSAFNLSKWLQFISLLIAILFVTYFSIEETPDVLFAGILLWYIYFINKVDILLNNRNAAFIGFLGALLYFTKAIGFYIFLTHITCYVIYWLLKRKNLRTTILKQYLSALIVFTAISSVWITALTFKYHHLTISDAGKYNFAIVGPKNISLVEINIPLKHPINTGVFDLPDKYSLNYWERPQVSTAAMLWNPFSSSANFIFFLHLIKQNFLRLYYDILFRLSFALWILSVVLFSFVKKEILISDFKILSLIVLAALLVLPYISIFVMPRYLLAAELLLFIATVYNFNAIEISSNRARGAIILLVFIATITIGRYWLINFKQYDNSRTDFQLAYSNINKLAIKGSIVSIQAGYDAMLSTSLLTYYTHNPYLGQIPLDDVKEKKYQPLYNKVKYLFVWNFNYYNDTLFTNFNTVFLDTASHLKIFDITKHQ